MNLTKKFLNRVLAIVLSVLMIVAIFPMGAFASDDAKFATVSTFTGGTVENNNTEEVKVLVEETTLEWVEGNEQRAEGWWVGIKVEAPEEDFSEDATLQIKKNPAGEYGEALKFADYKDGDKHIELWFPVSKESLQKDQLDNTRMYAFDWNADGENDQEIIFSVVPSSKIVLMKDGEQVFPAITYNVKVSKTGEGLVKVNGEQNAETTVEKGTDVSVEITAEAGKVVKSVKVNDEEISTFDTVGSTIKFNITSINENKNVDVTFKAVSNATADIKDLFNDEAAVYADGMTFVYKKDGKAEFSTTDKDGIILYGENGSVIAGGNDKKSAEIKETTKITKIELVYKAEDEMTAMPHVVEGVSAENPLLIVVDETAPEISVGYDNNEVLNETYYKSDRTATIKITEDYFDAEKVEIKVNGVKKTPTFTTVGNEHTATVEFKDAADYTLTVNCTDLAGNKATEYTTSFTIDKNDPPVIEVENVSNGEYYNTDRTATITVTEKNFSAEGMVVTVNGTDKDVVWTTDGDKHTTTVEFKDDDHYTLAVKAKDLAGNEVSKSVAFCVDKTNPVELKVSYDESVLHQFIEAISFGYYKAPVKVTLKATDKTAGVEYFEYSYDVESGASDTNKGGSGKIGANSVEGEANVYSATFEIPAQFRGKVSFEAYDKSGNKTQLKDGKTIVVDTVAPGVDVAWKDTVAPSHDNYYKADRTAKIKITEANFYAEDVVITVGKTLNDGTNSIEELQLEFAKDGDTYTSEEILFNENADYTFSIDYTDRSGNSNGYTTSFTIDKTDPAISVEYDNNEVLNEKYYKADRTATFTVVERNFCAEEFKFTAEAVDVVGNEVDLSSKAYTEYLANPANWTEVEPDTYKADITLDIDGNYEIGATYADMAGNKANEISDTFCVDKTNPVELNVSYDESVLHQFIEAISFGYYKAPVEVTLEAKDVTAGMDYFVYSYDVETGASAVNQGKSNVEVVPTRDGETNRWYTTFTIDPQFRGEVSFTAYDKSGNKTQLKDDKIIVVDNVAPGVEVAWASEATPSHDNYYAANRTATITITEANFYAEDVVITVGKTLNDGTYTSTKMQPEFTKNGDVYTATILFDENADYTFSIDYTDRSGNALKDPISYDEQFTVDKIDPVIEVEKANGTYYDVERRAIFTVVEHNFKAEEFAFTAKAVDVFGNEVDLSSKAYADYLANPENWKAVEPDTYKAEITLDIDGNYEIGATYADMAGNKANEISDTFCVDKTAPANLKISYSESLLDKVIEAITFGYYNAPVQVTLEATDATAGMDYFVYSYDVEDGASAVNQGESNVKALPTRDGETNRWYTTFTIDPQFRGEVSFTAYDKSGNKTQLKDDKIIVVDNVAPGVEVAWASEATPSHDNYYADDRIATITIEEANFYAEDVVITVGKTLNDGTYTETVMYPEFTKNGDVYTATILFDENADYTFSIDYIDRSSNALEEPETYNAEFTVDKIDPVISVEYDNIDVLNKTYYKADRTATFTVVEHNFCAEEFAFTAKAVDVVGKKVDLSSKAYADYLANPENWTEVEPDTYKAEITFDIEGNYEIGATYADMANNAQVEAISDAFCVDKTAPADLKISYEPRFIDTVLKVITFGFYQGKVDVTLEATDATAGMDYFVYSYEVEEGASDTNKGDSNVEVVPTRDGETNRWYTTFEIPAQFRGNVSFTAFDKSGNSETASDKNVVVVDNIAPGVEVEWSSEATPLYDNYYKADRKAKITITESNFFGTKDWDYADITDDFLVITVGKTLNDGTYTSTKMQPEFTKNGDVYTAEILFDENADYTFDIKYTDRSGNVYDEYEEVAFTVDKIAPVINLAYNDSNALYSNENQFRTDRVATITVVEHNFKAEDIVANVVASGAAKAEYEKYAAYLANPANWTTTGDIHTATITYNQEAHYTFEIAYTDMAGNTNNGVDTGDYKGPFKFTIDKSAPTELDITINNVSVVGSMTTHAFDTFYTEEVVVKLSAKFDISGMHSMTYQKVANIDEYKDVNGTWLPYNAETGIVVSPSEKFVIYFRAEDKSGNVTIIRTTGIVVDNKQPTGEVNAPDIDILPDAPNENGIHSGDVNVDLKVIDPKYNGELSSETGHYSGLKVVTYKIYTTDTDAVETGTLFELGSKTTGATVDKDNLVTTWAGSITVKSAKFNSNNVIVELEATDNAGNTRTTTTEAGDIKIDITVPTIEVSYDNNKVDSGSYFKANRTATITVTERNFDEADVVATIKNTHGTVPTLSKWTKVKGTGNEDDTKWVATVKYRAEGDYTFGIKYTDLAGWEVGEKAVKYGESAAPTKFTIDKTMPKRKVVYNNNDALNTNYYKAARVATATIVEHNFNAKRVNVIIEATDDGRAIAKPVVTKWTAVAGKVDTYEAKIYYSKDAKYVFDIEIKDKAGNAAENFKAQTFYVDKTEPTLEITGVADNSANNGDVIPVVSYTDTNYDESTVKITLTGSNRGGVALDGSYSNVHNGRVFTFRNFAKEQEVDDIYTINATLTDKAGNSTEKTLSFSVNRFGSVYTLNKDAKALNGNYDTKGKDIVITETNANSLSNIKVTLFKDGETKVLKQNAEYSLRVTGGNGNWYQYIYTVFAKNFEDDGVYSITVESDDQAGNKAKNDQEVKNTAINFGIDSTLPIINVENLESKKTYAVDSLKVNMSVKDNLKLTKVIVELDGKEKAAWTGEELEKIIKNGGNFSFDIDGESTKAHNLKVISVDAAGNEQIEEISDFFVTTNFWVRYYTNKPLFFGSIAGVILIAALVVFLVVYKKKKNA